MTGAFERTVFRSRSGSVVGTGFGCPRCFRPLDPEGHDLAHARRVDLATAFRILADRRRGHSESGRRIVTTVPTPSSDSNEI